MLLATAAGAGGTGPCEAAAGGEVSGNVPGGRAELLTGLAATFSLCEVWCDGSSSESCREVLGQRTRRVLVSLARINPGKMRTANSRKISF